MRRGDITRTHRRRQGRGDRHGYSLVETMAALVVMSILIAMGIPRFQRSMEQARANVAWANLQSIWSAQRLYWLENRAYATDLGTLQGWSPSGSLLPVVDPTLPTSSATASYVYQAWPDGSATATRNGSTSWSGSFTIAADGTVTGSVQQSGHSIVIGPSFQ